MYWCKHAKPAEIQPKTAYKLSVSLLAMVLVCSLSISGALAWLTMQSRPVVNTFTYGDVQIALTETSTGYPDDNPDDGIIYNQYLLMPGGEIMKDPVVTVDSGSEFCWLFVKLDKSENFDDYLTYQIADGWTLLPETDEVYYREIGTEDDLKEAAQGFAVLQDNQVCVKDGVSRDMLNALGEDPAAYPVLTITAYAIQLEEIEDAETAWSLLCEQAGVEDLMEV